jgi:hypothetical protein
MLYFLTKSTRFCGVVVITFALHAKGLRFDPGQKQKYILIRAKFSHLHISVELIFVELKLVLPTCRFCGVAVITFASHAKGPRFDPGQKHFFKTFYSC